MLHLSVWCPEGLLLGTLCQAMLWMVLNSGHHQAPPTAGVSQVRQRRANREYLLAREIGSTDKENSPQPSYCQIPTNQSKACHTQLILLTILLQVLVPPKLLVMMMMLLLLLSLLLPITTDARGACCRTTTLYVALPL